MNIFDSHTHSRNSHDGQASVEQMCLAAMEKGVKGFALTDHCEVDLFKGDYKKPVQHSFDEAFPLKEKYRGKLKISAGIELGQANYNTKLAKEIIDKNDYDVVIASTHGIGDSGDICKLDYQQMTMADVDKLLNDYFNYYLEMVTICDYDIAAHLTYPTRYIEGNYGIPLDLGKYDNIINEILRTVANRGKALEMNTSGLRQTIGRPFPTSDIVKRFLDYGGELVTLGSDAHRVCDIASGIEECLESLKSVGLKYYAFYTARKPEMVKIG